MGWPVMLAPYSQDGDTELTVWTETPDSYHGDKFVLGGRSTSKDFTEQDECDKQGCAYSVLWRKIGSRFSQHTVFTNV